MTGTASCTAGDKLLSGGFHLLNQGVEVLTSRAAGTPYHWEVRVYNPNLTSAQAYVYAICLDV